MKITGVPITDQTTDNDDNGALIPGSVGNGVQVDRQ